MDSGQHRLPARQLVEALAARGRYDFTSAEAQAALGVSPAAAKLALNRLAKRGIVASPARGFYLVVPPEYRALGCPPADQFIPLLMKRSALPYYAALLSAAQYHGAAHQRPQAFQVFLERSKRRINCGKVRVIFTVRRRLREVPVQSLNTPRGPLLISTPEATALDLVGYHRQAGGLDHVATLLSELAERLLPEKLAVAATTALVPWAQRLGYLLEHVGATEKVAPLRGFVREHARDYTVLLPGADYGASVKRNADWKLLINTVVEPEL